MDNFTIMFSNIEKYYRPKEISYLIAEKLRLILVSKAYGFNILKRCGKELKIAVNFMDVDDISFEVECCKTLYNYLYTYKLLWDYSLPSLYSFPPSSSMTFWTCTGILSIQSWIFSWGSSFQAAPQTFIASARFFGAPFFVVFLFKYPQQGSIAFRSGEFPHQRSLRTLWRS